MDAKARKTINTWWTTIGLFLLYVCFNGYSKTQGWNFILPGFVFEGFEPHAVAMLALILITPLTYILYKVSRFYSDNIEPPPTGIFLAFPEAFSSNISSDYTLSRHYQYLFIFLFVAFPLISSIHFIDKFWSGCRKLEYCMAWNGLSVLGSNDFQFYGVTFFPYIEPIFITLLFAVNFVFFLKIFFCAYKAASK